MDYFKNQLLTLLRSEAINFLVFKIRFLYFVHVKGGVRSFENGENVRANDYSIKMLKRGTTSNRPLKLIRPLSVIEAAKKDGDTLSIGSRFETELLYLQAYGFNPEKIRGLDMVSYSGWIDLGNMHALPYEANSKDTVILGWVLPYSDSPETAASEVIRVTRSGGLVAIGHTAYSTAQIAQMMTEGNYAVRPDLRKQKTEEILELFGASVDRVFYRHDPVGDREGTCAVIFSIKK